MHISLKQPLMEVLLIYISMYRDFDIAVFSGIANYPSSTDDTTLTQIQSKVFE